MGGPLMGRGGSRPRPAAQKIPWAPRSPRPPLPLLHPYRVAFSCQIPSGSSPRIADRRRRGRAATQFSAGEALRRTSRGRHLQQVGTPHGGETLATTSVFSIDQPREEERSKRKGKSKEGKWLRRWRCPPRLRRRLRDCSPLQRFLASRSPEDASVT